MCTLVRLSLQKIRITAWHAALMLKMPPTSDAQNYVQLARKYYFKNFRFGIFQLLTIWKIFRSAGYMVPFRYPVVLYRPRDRPSLGPRWVRGPAYPGQPSGRWDDPPEPTAPRSYVTRATPVSRVLHAPQPTVYKVWNGHSTFNAPSCC